ncbi:MAG: Fic family protein [Candidatus Gracilibacteria bacterium]|jgi:Fic family protein|nr:Fic family protein [Candidatus Gracilibacteria bacterium]
MSKKPLFTNLEKYLNSEEEKNPLVQIAIAHYQFEAIHPFLYLSEFFEEHLEDYYELLRLVSEKEKWEDWIKFFLTALATQAEQTEKIGKSILDLHAKYKENIIEINSVYTINLLDAIFVHPIFRTASIRKETKIKNTQTFFTLIGKFLEAGIIKDLTPKKHRNKVYGFDELIKLLNK